MASRGLTVEWLMTSGNGRSKWTYANLTVHRIRLRITVETDTHVMCFPLTEPVVVSHNTPLARDFTFHIKSKSQETTVSVFNEYDGNSFLAQLSRVNVQIVSSGTEPPSPWTSGLKTSFKGGQFGGFQPGWTIKEAMTEVDRSPSVVNKAMSPIFITNQEDDLNESNTDSNSPTLHSPVSVRSNSFNFSFRSSQRKKRGSRLSRTPSAEWRDLDHPRHSNA